MPEAYEAREAKRKELGQEALAELQKRAGLLHGAGNGITLSNLDIGAHHATSLWIIAAATRGEEAVDVNLNIRVDESLHGRECRYWLKVTAPSMIYKKPLRRAWRKVGGVDYDALWTLIVEWLGREAHMKMSDNHNFEVQEVERGEIERINWLAGFEFVKETNRINKTPKIRLAFDLTPAQAERLLKQGADLFEEIHHDAN